MKVVGEVTSANRHDKFDYDYPYAMTLRIYDNIFLQHDTGYGHPENAKRLENTVKYLQASGLWDQLRVEKFAIGRSAISARIISKKSYTIKLSLSHNG